MKPRVGRGSIGAFAAKTIEELAFFLDYVADPVIQEYLDGTEFTIDVLCDFTGRPISIVPRERVVIRAGVIDRGRTVADPDLMALALASRAPSASTAPSTSSVDGCTGCRPSSKSTPGSPAASR